MKLLPVINLLMTFEQLFSCGFKYFFSRINKNALLSDFISLAVSTRMPYCPILTFEDDST